MYKKYTKLLGVPESYVRKLLLIMRLTTIIIIASLLQVSASTFSQTVTLKAKNAPLSQIIKEICAQTDYEFLYNKEILKNSKPISIDVNNQPLHDVLKKCLEDQSINFTVEDRVVLLEKKTETTLSNKISAYLSSIDVHGKVVDEKGQPVPGANIRAKNRKAAAISDEKGNFTLKGLGEGEKILITYIGFNAKEVNAEKEMGVIRLDLASSKLDEVQVQAYGKTSQRLSTGNISSITAKQMENKPIINPILALQGEVPGINIVQASGYANSGIQIQIQGINSINKATDPLYVIDGIPFTSQLPNNMTGQGSSGAKASGVSPGSTAGNPLNFINPLDIEGISVLKDADATAIYGSRGANGVILITTKKGKSGDARVNVNLQQGFMKVSNFLKLMNTEQYLQMRRDAYFGTDKLTTSSAEWNTQYDLNGFWDTNRFTDWQKELVGKTAHYTDASASLEGGTEFDVYRIGLDYHKQTTIFNYSDANDQKGSVSLNFGHTSKNRKFKANLTTNYQLDFNLVPPTDLTFAVTDLAPNAPRLFNSDGTLNWQLDNSGTSTWLNPIASNLYSKKYGKTSNLISSLLLSYNLTKGLDISSNFGYTSLHMDEVTTSPVKMYSPEYVGYGIKASSLFNSGQVNGWQIEPQIKYSTQIGVGSFDVLLGTAFQQKNTNQQQIAGNDYSNDLLLESMNAAGSLSKTGSSITDYRYQGIFGRIGYNWKERFLINISGRRDGSSRFGGNNRFHNFGAVAGAWVFSEEDWVRSNIRWLSFGKVKVSYGTTGNDQIGDYKYLSTYSSSSYPVNYQGLSRLYVEDLPNPDLQWEETRKFSTSINLGFLHDRIFFEGTYYKNRSSNQLLDYTLPYITGFSTITANFPATVENSGLEMTVRASNIKTNTFGWSSSFNISFNKNKLVAFPNFTQSSYANSLVVGQSINTIKYFNYAGINKQTGLYQFYSSAGDVTSNPIGGIDDKIYVDLQPKYTGGFYNQFSYKNFSLDILFSFTKQMIQGYTFGITQPGSFNQNQPVSLVGNYWTEAGDEKIYQKVSSNYSRPINTALRNARNSDATYIDGSYVRLKNVALSYKIDASWLQKVKLRDMRFYANAQNLLTITNYEGIDPETGSRNMGPMRTVVFGVQLGL